jgi:hypothetical protein
MLSFPRRRRLHRSRPDRLRALSQHLELPEMRQIESIPSASIVYKARYSHCLLSVACLENARTTHSAYLSVWKIHQGREQATVKGNSSEGDVGEVVEGYAACYLAWAEDWYGSTFNGKYEGYRICLESRCDDMADRSLKAVALRVCGYDYA